MTDFEATLEFELDPFQVDAIAALRSGSSVLVAAPTGAGKTVVGEYCCHDALTNGGKTFYTTPIKALSNQKHRDLVEEYGADRVGLLTGDRAVNGDAPVVVMTTEVLRNMLYEQSPTLEGLSHVVLDEVHYLADRARGSVWEEVLIQLADGVQVSALSATVSNAEEFGEWLSAVRDGCEVIIEEHRPVPLRHFYWINDRIHPTFRAGRKGGANKQQRQQAARAQGGVPNPDVLMMERNARRSTRVNRRGRRVRTGPRLRWPSRPDVVETLDERGWLPAIIFVFSRAGCEKAVGQILRAGVSLTTPAERDEIARTADTLLADLPDDDLVVLDHASWRRALLSGVAAHHAGMVPAFKEVVERCFQAGLLKVVVATETLALGINMPARTVVIERLEKFNGETHVLLTPGQYTQLTGRAGRRGIDRIGNAVVNYQRNVDFKTVAGLVGTRTYPLRSSFTPSYNMAVNLLRGHNLPSAERLLEASFAQFQADRDLGDMGARLTRAEQDPGRQKEAARLRRRIEKKTGSLVRHFHRIVQVLQQRGYLDDTPRPTADGMRLAGLYSQVDLLVAEAVGQGMLDDLDGPGIAAICAFFLYEPRGGEATEHPDFPTPELEDTAAAVEALASDLRVLEAGAGLTPLGELDAGFMAASYRWAAGASLDDAIGRMEITGGDFVRTTRMVADLAGQLRSVGSPALAGPAQRAVEGLRRGIVDA